MISFRYIAALIIFSAQITMGTAIPLDSRDILVQTPVGPLLKSNTYQIPVGSRIQHTHGTVKVVGTDGTTLHTVPVSKDALMPVSGNATNPPLRRTLTAGYVASAYWGNTGPAPVKFYTTSWHVPAVPQNIDSQVIFLFNGLEPNSFDSILQPVLQFGGGSAAGGGDYWAVASWFVTGSSAFFTPLTVVWPSQMVTGMMTLQSTQTSAGVTTYNYNSMFQGLPSSSLNTSTTEELTIAFESLEIYGASGPTDLPRGKTAMENINLITQNGMHPSLNWSLFNVDSEGFRASVPIDGSTNGEVDLFYPLQ